MTNPRGERREIELSAGTVRYFERGSGTPALFVHGLGVNGNLWRKVVPGLADGLRCITPDWPLGAHAVAMRPEADLTPPGVARLIAELMDRLDLRDVVLVGNDTGGAICQMVIARHRERIGRLVLTPSDAYDNFLPLSFRWLQYAARVPPLLRLSMQVLRLRPARRLPLAFGLVAKRPIDHAVTDEYVTRLLDAPGVFRDTCKLLRGIDTRDTRAAAETFGSFDRPVLLVWPPDNPAFTWSFAERLAGDFPNAKLVAVDDSYTFVSEDQPQRLVDAIRDFLADTDAALNSRPSARRAGA